MEENILLTRLRIVNASFEVHRARTEDQLTHRWNVLERAIEREEKEDIIDKAILYNTEQQRLRLLERAKELTNELMDALRVTKGDNWPDDTEQEYNELMSLKGALRNVAFNEFIEQNQCPPSSIPDFFIKKMTREEAPKFILDFTKTLTAHPELLERIQVMFNT